MTVRAQPRLIHIFGRSPHHYVPMKVFLNTLALSEQYQQVFWAWQHPTEPHSVEGVDYYSWGQELVERIKCEPETTKFVFHGLLDRAIWPFLAYSSVVKRAMWVCWGTELYQHQQKQWPFKRRIMHLLHKFFARRFKCVFALNKGDAQLIQKLLWGTQAEVLPYPLIGVDSYPSPSETSNTYKVLIGNSADPSNQHIKMIDWLSSFSTENIEVVAPLSYAGSKEYVESVLAKGKTVFGEKFTGITNLLAKSEYDALLNDVDATVFAHERQQGLYVVYSMLKHGKKMYLQSSTTTFATLSFMGFSVFPSEDIKKMTFPEFVAVSADVGDSNKELMQQNFSEEALRPRWRNALVALMA